MTFDVREIDAGAADLVDPGIGRELGRVRLAALAGAEPGRARGVGRLEEADAVAARTAARAGRPAVDAGRGHGVDEAAVSPWIPRQNRGPPGDIRVRQLLCWCVRQSIHAQRMAHKVGRSLSAACDRIVLRSRHLYEDLRGILRHERFPLRPAHPPQGAGLHHRRRADAGTRHRREHRHLLAHRPGAAADAAGQVARAARRPRRPRRVPGTDVQQRHLVVPDVPRPARSEHGVRRRDRPLPGAADAARQRPVRARERRARDRATSSTSSASARRSAAPSRRTTTARRVDIRSRC